MTYFDDEAGADLKAAFDAIVLDWPAVTSTVMFGCPSYKADDTLFAVLTTDGVVLTQLSEGEREQVEASFDAGPFDAGPFDAGGRTVTKWADVTIDDVGGLEELEPYVEASYETALDESNA